MLCPNCLKKIRQDISVCPYCKNKVTQEVVENWKAEIDQVVLGYEEHKGLIHGLQKDAIQNGWGHRLTKKGKDWGFVFELIKWKKNEYLLTMTDIRGYGLTGKNMSTHEIPDELPENERLARFEHMYFSGGFTQGAGLFGRGKLIFTAASKDNYIIYDSLTHNGLYRLNRRRLVGRRLENYAKAFEGADAIEMLAELTYNNLKPLTISGTRVTILNPKDKIVKEIYDGIFLRYIEETWWQILLKYGKYGVNICIKTDKGIKNAKIPREFKDFPTSNVNKVKVKLIPNLNFSYRDKNLRIKKCHFICSPVAVSSEVRGVYLYRREMKVADLGLRDIPEEIADKFYGYVEIEANSEFEKIYLDEKIEGPEHYSINKYKGLIRKLRKKIQIEFEKFKSEIGYGINSARDVKEKTRRILEESLEELHKRMDELGICIGGKIRVSKDIKVSLDNLQFPSQSNVVNIGDKIKNIKFKIENISDKDHSLQVCVITRESSGKQIEIISEENVKLERKDSKKVGSFSFLIAKGKYPWKGKIFLSCIATDRKNNKKKGLKNIPIFIGETPKETSSIVEIDLEDIILPRGSGNKRVNYGESIKNIQYTVNNNSFERIKAILKVRILDAQKKNEIQPLYEEEVFLDSFKSKNIHCPDVVVFKEKYSILDREKGPVILRATVVALEDSKSGTFSKADKLAKLDFKFWVNMDSGKGIFEDCRSFEGGSDEPRSRIQLEGQGYVFFLNVTHPAYENIQENGDDSSMRTYTYEQLLRETLILLLLTDKVEYWPEIAGKNYKANIESESSEKQVIIESCLNTIDYLYADYLE